MAVQVATQLPPDESQSKPQQQQQPAAAIELPETPSGQRMTLEQMTRIMDVASTLRKERAVVEQQLNIGQVKAKLRERLLEAARVSGDTVTPEEIDAAIDQYYDRLHEFQEPKWSFRTMLAHLWVRRKAILRTLVGLAALWALIWALLASGLLPGEARNDAMLRRVQESAASIEEISADASLQREVDAIVKSAEAARTQGDAGALAELSRELRTLQAELNAEYTAQIVGDADQLSGFEDQWNDGRGQEASRYYVIVEARGADGAAVKVPITDAKTGETKLVSRWAEQVPESTFNQLAADKEQDGVLDQRTWAVKQRGERTVEVQATDAAGTPLTRMSQLTSWE